LETALKLAKSVASNRKKPFELDSIIGAVVKKMYPAKIAI
jgi:hypothetical protein